MLKMSRKTTVHLHGSVHNSMKVYYAKLYIHIHNIHVCTQYSRCVRIEQIRVMINVKTIMLLLMKISHRHTY